MRVAHRSGAWLANKLQHLGIQSLLADYATLSNRDRALDLICSALTLAAPSLAANPKELAPQLLRLAPGDAAGFGEFLRAPLDDLATHVGADSPNLYPTGR